ncbi:C39 family peptidase [Mycobacterium sp.]|uniref:C39 family peptidase n=1 Tax=Mycobacterium sp. TaxID=1785 RepID=UPI003F977F3F
MNTALTTAVAPAVRIAAVVACACSAAAVALVALAVAIGPLRPVHVAVGAIALEGNSQTGMYGDPAAAAPFWRLQHSSDCGEMAVADVVGQTTGNEPRERQITSLARTTTSITGAGPIYRQRTGTDIRNLPVLLAHYGVRSSLSQRSIGGLEQDLARGHKVIAAVNAQTIWNAAGDRNVDNHVVVVTGIDTQTGAVHLNDSGIKTGRDERVSLATFEKAWATSQNLAVVTG